MAVITPLKKSIQLCKQTIFFLHNKRIQLRKQTIFFLHNKKNTNMHNKTKNFFFEKGKEEKKEKTKIF